MNLSQTLLTAQYYFRGPAMSMPEVWIQKHYPKAKLVKEYFDHLKVYVEDNQVLYVNEGNNEIILAFHTVPRSRTN